MAKTYNYILVISRDKKTGGKGKPAALNAALKFATGEIIICFDADYFPQTDILQKLVEPFRDSNVGGVQGRPVVLNESQNLITRLIALERIGGFRVDQEARKQLKLIPQFGGTVGGFRRNLINNLGGFDESVLSEDTDLTFHIYLLGFKIAYAGNAECYEEVVSTLKAYWRQRHRWALGHMQVSCKHSVNVIKSKKLNWKEKVDGLLLLQIYFMPVLAMFSIIWVVLLFLFSPSDLVFIFWSFVPISLYSAVGNFAPFFEVGIGTYLDGRTRLQWLIPLLIFLNVFNMAICSKALFDLVRSRILRKKRVRWEKTHHSGDAKRYIES
jgi:cellulose synthase/poly-beta-1,6-N-acetylglucosamine synthase-like glycosyltransferase